MSETRHTPGPWEFGKAQNYLGWYIAPQGKLPTLAGIYNYPDQTEANARLIAAAPDLLDALRWYVENDDTNIGMEGNEFYETILARGQAAIRLAETGERT